MFNFSDVRGMFGAEFSRNSYSQAISEANGQYSYWLNVLIFIKKSIEASSSKDLDARYVDRLEIFLKNDGEGNFSVTERDNKYIISGRIPVILLDSTRISSFLNENPAKALGIIFAETADYFYSKPGSEQFIISDRALMYAAAYVAERNSPLIISLEDSQREIVGLQSKVGELKREIDVGSEKIFDEFKIRHHEILNKFQEETQVISHDRTKFSSSWEDFMRSAAAEVEATKKLAFENEALKAARDVWSGKLTRHRIGYWLGLTSLSIVIISLLVYYLKSSDNIHSILLKLRKPDGDLPYSVIILYIIPVFAIGWILRIFGSFVTSSRILWEDAEQRQAMLDTYFRLVGDQSAKMEPTDRVLILSAIFRPLPGQQADDVSPPSILDLAQNAVSKK